MADLTGKTVLITAAAQGIGRASALAFVKAGAKVIATDINASSAGRARRRRRRHHARARRAVRRRGRRLRRPRSAASTCCSTAPASSIPARCSRCSDEDLDFAFDLNVRAQIRTIQAVLPQMLERGDGAIVNMASVASSVKGVPNRFAYAISKAAVIGLTKSIAADYVDQGHPLQRHLPGHGGKPVAAGALARHGRLRGRPQGLHRPPADRPHRPPEEIADLAVYLAGATYTTGQVHIIDGGWTASEPMIARKASTGEGAVTGTCTAMTRSPLSDPRPALPHLAASLDGSDAMNPDPGLFGRLCDPGHRRRAHEGPWPDLHHRPRQRNRAARPSRRCTIRVVGLELDWIAENPGRFWRHVTGDSQLRWIGPDKGAMHLATGAVVNAVWDLLAKEAGKPVWQLVADMTPEQLVAHHRLPLPHRRHHARRGAGDLPRRPRPARPSASPRSRPRATPATPPRPAGWAIPTRS